MSFLSANGSFSRCVRRDDDIDIIIDQIADHVRTNIDENDTVSLSFNVNIQRHPRSKTVVGLSVQWRANSANVDDASLSISSASNVSQLPIVRRRCSDAVVPRRLNLDLPARGGNVRVGWGDDFDEQGVLLDDDSDAQPSCSPSSSSNKRQRRSAPRRVPSTVDRKR